MQVYDYSSPPPHFQALLKSTLPHSISLMYRTQHPNRTPTAHILATIPPEPTLTPPKCWAAAYFDRSMRPETELWIFSTGQIPGHSPSTSELCPGCKKAVLSLLDYISTLPITDLHPETTRALEAAKEHEKEFPETGPHIRFPANPGTYMRHLLMPSVILLGGCQHQIVKVCADAGLLREEFPGSDADLNKFWFKVADLPQTKELPEGLRWGELREEDIAVVQSRTEIPRATRTLLSLKSVGVFEKEGNRAIAWTFLGLDGSLTTLHTEPEYRGRGIAKNVAAKIFRDYAPGLAEDEEGNAWAHADVYVGNDRSERVCRGLGGKASEIVSWVRIDIARAGALAKG